MTGISLVTLEINWYFKRNWGCQKSTESMYYWCRVKPLGISWIALWRNVRLEAWNPYHNIKFFFPPPLPKKMTDWTDFHLTNFSKCIFCSAKDTHFLRFFYPKWLILHVFNVKWDPSLRILTKMWSPWLRIFGEKVTHIHMWHIAVCLNMWESPLLLSYWKWQCLKMCCIFQNKM